MEGFPCQQLVWMARHSLVSLGLWSLGSKRGSWLIYFSFHSNCPEIELKNKVLLWLHAAEWASHVGLDREIKRLLWGWLRVLTLSAAAVASLWLPSFGRLGTEDCSHLYWSAWFSNTPTANRIPESAFWVHVHPMPKMILNVNKTTSNMTSNLKRTINRKKRKITKGYSDVVRFSESTSDNSGLLQEHTGRRSRQLTRHTSYPL